MKTSHFPADSSAAKARAIARALRLRYVEDHTKGITRVGRPGSFAYKTAAGRAVTDPDTLLRIKALVLPPAWRQVWISPWSNGHLQATGNDQRGRLQYRYHPQWTSGRERSKYDKVIHFAEMLPQIRRVVDRDLQRRGLPREKVLGAVVAVMEKTLIRVGNDEYAESNHSYGLTTLRNRHAKISRKKVHFEFRGKSGVQHSIDLQDPKLARIIRQCRDLPQAELFAYRDEAGKVHDVKSSDVNAYLKSISGADFTAKDFRTWAGTFLAAQALRALESFDSQAQAKKNIRSAIESVARKLGNTKTVCRRCYIHPEILNAYLDGHLIKQLAGKGKKLLSEPKARLSADEKVVLALLNRRLQKQARLAA